MPSFKTVENKGINSVFAKPLMISVRDDDGDIVWKDPNVDEAKRVPTLEQAKPQSIIREILLSINGLEALRRIQKPNDGFRAHRLWNQLERAKESEYIRLRSEEYEWLHSLLSRKVPVNKEAKDAGVEDRTVASQLYGINEWMVCNALKSIDERQEEEHDETEDRIAADGQLAAAATGKILGSPSGAER